MEHKLIKIERRFKAKSHGVSNELIRRSYKESISWNLSFIININFGIIILDANIKIDEIDEIVAEADVLKPKVLKMAVDNPTSYRHVMPFLQVFLGVPRHLRKEFKSCRTLDEMARFAEENWNRKKSHTFLDVRNIPG